jgi:hypothetical protein
MGKWGIFTLTPNLGTKYRLVTFPEEKTSSRAENRWPVHSLVTITGKTKIRSERD